MKHKQLEEMRNNLQKIMLRAGGRLGSLDGEQIVTRMRNNNFEGKAYPSPLTSLGDIMATQKQQVVEGTPSAADTEGVAPAGGVTDSEVVSKFFEAVKRPGSTIVVGGPTYKGYSRLFLEAAIPTAVYVGGIVTAVVAATLIDNKWGMGARQNKLIAAGALDHKALGNGGMSMDISKG